MSRAVSLRFLLSPTRIERGKQEAPVCPRSRSVKNVLFSRERVPNNVGFGTGPTLTTPH